MSSEISSEEEISVFDSEFEVVVFFRKKQFLVDRILWLQLNSYGRERVFKNILNWFGSDLSKWYFLKIKLGKLDYLPLL